MKLSTIATILKDDDQFKSNVKFATAIAAAIIAYGSYYGLSKRVSDIEDRFAKPGDIEATLEKIPAELPKKKTAQVNDYQSRIYNNKTMIKMNDQDLICLARNIYHEARFEPYIGKIAVAQVTFNRAMDGKWGDTICEVVYARKQFSWTLNKKLKYKELHGKRWNEVMHVAKMFQYGVRVRDINSNVKWYHADYVSPKWRNDFTRVSKLGRHIFYAKNNERQLLSDSR